MEVTVNMDILFGINALATAGEPTVGGGEGMFLNILFLVLMVGVFYFILIRPQKKKEKKTKEMIAALKVSDTLTTIGGIKGKVVKIKEDEVVIETGSIGNPAEKSFIRMSKWAIRDVDVKEKA